MGGLSQFSKARILLFVACSSLFPPYDLCASKRAFFGFKASEAKAQAFVVAGQWTFFITEKGFLPHFWAYSSHVLLVAKKVG
jgi:hypothetical protein